MEKQKGVSVVLSGIIKILLSVAVVLFLYMGAIRAYDFGYRIFAEEPVSEAPGRDITVTITEGMSGKEIAELLEEKGVIRDDLIFYIQNQFSHYKGSFQAGTYELNTSMDNDEIMAVLSGEASLGS